jgi:hypothetical protein
MKKYWAARRNEKKPEELLARDKKPTGLLRNQARLEPQVIDAGRSGKFQIVE